MEQACKLLAKRGFFELQSLYSLNLIKEWNTLLDPHFLVQDNKARSYVKANTLFELGIINKIFNKQLQSLLCSLMPDAIFYHCHAYEISSSAEKSHIHWGENLGWHRDEECRSDYNCNQANHISMFIYLTNVDEENGPFEIRLNSPLSYLQLKEKTLKVFGKPGTVFFFNRFFWHRACPNRSSIRRRVIKLSFQPRQFKNDRIDLEEFVRFRQLVPEQNKYLEYLVNPEHPATSLLEIMGQSYSDNYPQPKIPPLNSSMEIKLNYLAKYNYNLLKQEVKKKLLTIKSLSSQ